MIIYDKARHVSVIIEMLYSNDQMMPLYFAGIVEKRFPVLASIEAAGIPWRSDKRRWLHRAAISHNS